jgi:ferredoxin
LFSVEKCAGILPRQGGLSIHSSPPFREYNDAFVIYSCHFCQYRLSLRLATIAACEGKQVEEDDMRIVVDLNRCQGYAQCVPLAPTVLKLNGEEALMYDPNPDDSLRQQVLRAAASCPVQAIIVDRLDEKGEKA